MNKLGRFCVGLLSLGRPAFKISWLSEAEENLDE